MEQFRSTRSRALLFAAGALVATAAVVGPNAIGATGSQPANKVVAAGSKTEVIAPNTNKVLMSATMKTSKPTDLILQVSMECSILTQLVTGATGQATSTAEASGLVRAWVEVDGQITPIISMSNPPQGTPPAGDDTDKVTFCNRIYSRTVTDREGDNAQDQNSDYIRTKDANAFNWLRLNVGAGDHTIVVKGDLVIGAMGDPGTQAEAVVGNRSLIVEPTKMANDAIISDTGS